MKVLFLLTNSKHISTHFVPLINSYFVMQEFWFCFNYPTTFCFWSNKIVQMIFMWKSSVKPNCNPRLKIRLRVLQSHSRWNSKDIHSLHSKFSLSSKCRCRLFPLQYFVDSSFTFSMQLSSGWIPWYYLQPNNWSVPL